MTDSGTAAAALTTQPRTQGNGSSLLLRGVRKAFGMWWRLIVSISSWSGENVSGC